MAFAPSPYQQQFFEWLASGRGSAVMCAVAGSGKSTTLGYGLTYLPPSASVLVLAFNASIAKDFKARIERLAAETGRDMSRVRAGTFHSVGFGAVLKHIGLPANRVVVDGKKCSKLLRDRFTPVENEVYGAFAARLVSLAKGEGIGALVPDTDDAWYNLISHHDLYLEAEEATVEGGIDVARRLLAMSNDVAREGHIDFDDQLYLVCLWRLRLCQNDVVFVDEAQDTNRVRRAIAKLALRPGGRLVAVGDARQAIYGFCHPAGTKVLTPNGSVSIEKLKVGSSVIVASTSGETAGWAGNCLVKEVHQYEHSGLVIRVSAGERFVEMTPHHRIPVRIDPGTAYYTYLMVKDGVYRVGYCQAFAQSQFMLNHRTRTERADAAWVLGSFTSREAAREAEGKLLLRVKGTTFSSCSDDEVAGLPTDEVEALKLLAEHGRMVDFPLIKGATKHRISRRGAFVVEACNILDGMLVAFYDEAQRNTSRRGRNRQQFAWTPCQVTSRHYNGKVYGITVPVLNSRDTYQPWPLYFGGNGNLLVHNTGASPDAIDLIKREFNCCELPLTISYRCAKAIATHAAELVPYFEAHAGAPEGRVDPAVALDDALKMLDGHDAVLCRNVKPLIDLAYTLIGRGVGCYVLGREIGDGLINLVKKMKARGIDNLAQKLAAYEQREVAAFVAKGEEGKAEAVSDRVACITTIIDQMDENNRTVPALIRRIEALFSEANGVLTLSTVHKAKGREWRRVAILAPELMPSKWARQDWQQKQEENLMYVARTRAIEHLMYLV